MTGNPPLGAAVCADLARALRAIEPEIGLRLSPQMTQHLAGCPGCRRAVADADPTALFSMLSLERTDDSFWTGFETRTLARIREIDAQPARWDWRGRRFWPVAAASALLGAAAVLLVTILLRQGPGPAAPNVTIAKVGAASGDVTSRGGGSPAIAANPGRLESPPAAAPEVVISGGRGPFVTGPMLPLPQDSAADPSPVESISSATARVISIRVDASKGRKGPVSGRAGQIPPQDSDVVLIVDQGIDI